MTPLAFPLSNAIRPCDPQVGGHSALPRLGCGGAREIISTPPLRNAASVSPHPRHSRSLRCGKLDSASFAPGSHARAVPKWDTSTALDHSILTKRTQRAKETA
jgi:hypothetical protein